MSTSDIVLDICSVLIIGSRPREGEKVRLGIGDSVCEYISSEASDNSCSGLMSFLVSLSMFLEVIPLFPSSTLKSGSI